MKRKKRKSLFSVAFTLILVLTVLLGTLDVVVYNRFYKSGWYKNKKNPAEMVDVTDPEANTDFGRLYYSPVNEEHITEYPDSNGEGYIDNEVLIVAADGVTHEQVAELAASYDAEIVGEIEVTGDYQLRLTTSPDSLDSTLESISAEPIVASASLNYVTTLSQEGDIGDFYYGKKWNSEFREFLPIVKKSWGFKQINTTAAWNELYTHSSDVSPVKVGVCDEGFSSSHPDLGFAGLFYDNYDKGIKLSDKEKSHGTHVSGTFAANTDDNIGICGVYPYGKGNLYGASVSGSVRNPDNGSFFNSVMCEKVTFGELIVRNVKVINFSMGFNYRANRFTDSFGIVNSSALASFWNNPSSHTYTAQQASILGDFYDRLLKKGYDFVLCASAGNDSDDKTGHLEAKYNSPLNLIEYSEYPDVYDRIIVVGSLDRDKSASSGVSVSEYSNGGSRTDIYAPGRNIYSTYHKDYSDYYEYLSGTSMATPHVSGVAAMVWSANNSLTGAQVKDIILSNPNPSEPSLVTLDAYSAVLAALGLPNTTVTTDSNEGALYGFVIDKGIIDKDIVGAKITITNMDTHDTYTGVTDSYGHYEISAPEGKYSIQVKAKGYKDYKPAKTVNIQKCQITYLGKLALKKGKSSLDDEKDELPAPEIGKIYTPDDLRIFFPDGLEDYNYLVKLLNIKAWTYYDGHLYAVLDRSVPPSLINLITTFDDSLHLITVGSEGEQKLAEELMTYGERDVYSSGGIVGDDGSIFSANSEDNNYTNWQAGCPNRYGNEYSDDIITVYRGPGEKPKTNTDYGRWIDMPEFEYGIFVSDDTVVSSGIIIEIESAEEDKETE